MPCSLAPLAWELSIGSDILALFCLQQGLQEHLAESIVWVLVDLCVIFLLRIEFLRLLRQFVDGDLPDDEREVLSVGVTDLVLFVRGSSDVSLVRKLELSFHIVQTLLILFDAVLLIFFIFFPRLLWWLDLLK